VASADDRWPQFRGPTGDGQAEASELPLTWSEDSNIKWKRPIHGRAWSSPVVWDDQIWLTTATEDGTQLFAICVDRATGRVVHDLKLFDVETPQFAHKFNSYASPTPVIEKGRVYVTFGSPGTACLDVKSGRVLWQRRDLECNHFRGAGSSPILYRGLLLMNFDGSDHQFMIALDKKTGRTVWRAERSIDFKDLGPDGKPDADGDWRKAFSTPQVIRVGFRRQLISQGAKAIYAYEPRTGKELWRVEERTGHSAGDRPVWGDGLIFLTTGWSRGQVLAIRPGRGGGEVIDANDPDSWQDTKVQVRWKRKRSVPRKPSLQWVDGLLISIDDGGIATCLEAATGDELWSERVRGNYSASPLVAGGRVYFFSEEGKTTVIEAGRQFKVLAENELPDGFMASAAVAGKALFLRTKKSLYRIER
jgi:outer membrane protein assembly factor BamB